MVATAANGTEAITRFPAARPDVLVLDLQIPEPNGVAVTAEVVQQNPAVRVLILSASGEQQDVLEAVKAGATGYLVKSASRGRAARRRTTRGARGHRVHPGPGRAGAGGVPPPLRHRPADAKDDTPRLTERETEVLRLVAKGMSYKQIAERLFLSHRTVQNHVQNTLRKLQLHNRVQLVRYAIEQGLDDERVTRLPGARRDPGARGKNHGLGSVVPQTPEKEHDMGQGTLLFRASLGDVLRAERMRQGMTLRELSSSARVSLGYISEIERGQKEASSELLAALCEALDVPLSGVLREVSDHVAGRGARPRGRHRRDRRPVASPAERGRRALRLTSTSG